MISILACFTFVVFAAVKVQAEDCRVLVYKLDGGYSSDRYSPVVAEVINSGSDPVRYTAMQSSVIIVDEVNAESALQSIDSQSAMPFLQLVVEVPKSLTFFHPLSISGGRPEAVDAVVLTGHASSLSKFLIPRNVLVGANTYRVMCRLRHNGKTLAQSNWCVVQFH